MRSSRLLAAVAAVCASGAAQAAHVGVFIGGAVPGYYAPAPYYYQPAPPPPPQYIQRGPDGQPVPAPGPYDAPQYAPDGSTPYPPPGAAPQYPEDDDGAPPYPQGTAPQYAPGSPAPAPDDDNEPSYPQGSAPQSVTPQEGGDTWYFCEATKTYYPYVKDCASGWQQVPAQPTQPPSQSQ